jgi:hypothetical protein
MSLTEVYLETANGHTTSRGSLALRERSSSSEGISDGRKNFSQGGDIELAQFDAAGRVADTSDRVSTRRVSSVLPSNIPKHSNWAANIQFFALLWSLFLLGWNDGTVGPMLLRIQSNYHMCTDTVVAVLDGR